ncbi:MAG: alpha-amylase family glycosyl hydrolase [Bacteroidales bacterium]
MKRSIFFGQPYLYALLMAATFIFASCNQADQQKKNTNEALSGTVPHPEWSKDAILYEVNVRQFTPEGTFNAFAEHLPRIKEMGVDILWFMPVTPIGQTNRKGSLGSYYSVQDYTAINPEFGTMEDFKSLVEQIHALDMHVIIDWVANHTAWDHDWTTTHPEYYHTDSLGNFTPPYDTDWTDVIQLDYDNKDLWSAMTEEMKFWVEEMNIDGFRCDVAYLVPEDFWDMARAELEEVKPVFMLAEADHPELMENAFNTGYSWTFHHAMNGIAQGTDSVASLNRYFFEENQGNYPDGAYKINFISNHDENSWAGTVFERLGEAMETFAVLANTAPGMFLIYNGQEAALDKRLDFFEKDTINWDDLQYQDFYTTLFELKAENKALWNGNAGGAIEKVTTSKDDRVFAFSRMKDDNKVFVVTNLSDSNTSVSFIEGDFTGTWNELYSDEQVIIDKSFNLEMEPWEYKVYYWN